jgi:T5SS/PEP-CTERM-associated repeat protein
MRTAFVRGCLAALVLCSAVAGHAESYTTNIVNGVTTNVGGVYIVGSTGPFNGLIITNAGVLINTDGIIGNTAAASNNFALITGSSSIWSNGSQFTVGVTGAFNSVTITNGGLLHDMYGYVGYNAAASNNTGAVRTFGQTWNHSVPVA